MDNSYHLLFQLAFFELVPQFKNISMKEQKGYKYKNIKQNFIIQQQFDQILLITTYGQMYFLYIIWISRKKCYILDPQLKPQQRMLDHQLVVRQILETHFGLHFDLDCLLLKEVKQDPKHAIRGAIILDFLFKYIESDNEVQRIERIKIGQSDATQLLNKITWFIYKCHNEKIYIANDLYQIQPKLDKMFNFEEWKELQDDQQQKQQETKRQISNLKSGSLQQSAIPNNNKSSSTFFSSIASNQIISSKSDINAQSFLNQMEYKNLPKASLKDPERNQLEKSESKIVMTRSEIQEMLSEAKKNIKEDLMRELKWESEQIMQEYEQKLSAKYTKVDQEIAEEYLNQVRFQRYKQYLEYLMEYNLNNDPNEYQNLLNEYHAKLKSTALNGMADLQRKELLKLKDITQRRLKEETNAIEMAMYNQKRIQIKNPQKIITKPSATQVINPNSNQRYQFKFALQQEINPFAFRNEQAVEQQRKKIYSFEKLDLSEEQIQQLEQAWKFNNTPSQSSFNSENLDEELKRMKYMYGDGQQQQYQQQEQSVIQSQYKSEKQSQNKSEIQSQYKSIKNSEKSEFNQQLANLSDDFLQEK